MILFNQPVSSLHASFAPACNLMSWLVSKYMGRVTEGTYWHTKDAGILRCDGFGLEIRYEVV